MEACKYTEKGNNVAMYRKNNICISCVFNGFKYNCTRPAAQPLVSKGQQTSWPLCMFDYVAQDHHTCLNETKIPDKQLCLQQPH